MTDNTTTYSDAELIAWANRQRRLYRDGKLSATRIKKLESIPGWTWEDEKPPTKAGPQDE